MNMNVYEYFFFNNKRNNCLNVQFICIIVSQAKNYIFSPIKTSVIFILNLQELILLEMNQQHC